MRVEYCKEAYEDYEDEDYEDLSEMANVTTVDSGLPFPVWIIYNGALKFTEPDRPLVKVEINDCRIPCLIDSRSPGFTDNTHAEIIEKLNPEDVELLNRWIMKNYPTLINHWNGLLTDKQALNTLRSV